MLSVSYRETHTRVGVALSQPVSHASPLLTDCSSHSCFSGIHLLPYHNGDPAWAPGALQACVCLPGLWCQSNSQRKPFLSLCQARQAEYEHIPCSHGELLQRGVGVKHIHSWGLPSLHSLTGQSWAATLERAVVSYLDLKGNWFVCSCSLLSRKMQRVEAGRAARFEWFSVMFARLNNWSKLGSGRDSDSALTQVATKQWSCL